MNAPLKTKPRKRERHGMRYHPAYVCWCDMLKRCYNPNVWNYYQYGGRGISVCDRWRHSFTNFWADMGPAWKPHLTIDREDDDPDNCQWLDDKSQCRNRHSTRWVKTPWGVLSMAEATERTAIPYYTLQRAIAKGKSLGGISPA